MSNIAAYLSFSSDIVIQHPQGSNETFPTNSRLLLRAIFADKRKKTYGPLIAQSGPTWRVQEALDV